MKYPYADITPAIKYLKIVIPAHLPACCRQVRHDGVSLFNGRVNIKNIFKLPNFLSVLKGDFDEKNKCNYDVEFVGDRFYLICPGPLRVDQLV
jgi:hypothetical protein